MIPRVLILDDEPAVRESLTSLLETLDLGVVAAAGIEEAVAALDRHPFQLILADLSLGGKGGKEGLEFVTRVRRRGLNTPVVVFTGLGSEEVRAEALARGAKDLWSKSLPIEDFVARVLGAVRPAAS